MPKITLRKYVPTRVHHFYRMFIGNEPRERPVSPIFIAGGRKPQMCRNGLQEDGVVRVCLSLGFILLGLFFSLIPKMFNYSDYLCELCTRLVISLFWLTFRLKSYAEVYR
ncbi:hypothetical protein Y032_0635g919 [Ancylostoma ceylanicum]|uniref:Uncharacterized protein n=1 Tax=Ancylostoma ceylanicum TaxID=53326 RepID=A0A016WLQ1_9BILA|nr:hypothetical protein Y032_0635g919 [Ancylostoma ceylanicum]